MKMRGARGFYRPSCTDRFLSQETSDRIALMTLNSSMAEQKGSAGSSGLIDIS